MRMYAVVFAMKLCGSVCVFFYNKIAMRKSSWSKKKKMHVVGCLVTCPVWFGLISVRSKWAHPVGALWLLLYVYV